MTPTGRRDHPVILAFATLAVLASVVYAASPSLAQTPPVVVVDQVRQERVGLSAEFVARVEAIEAVDIQSRVQGFLEAVVFGAGQSVEIGDTLFLVQREQYDAEAAAARARMARAEASLTEARDTLTRTRELRGRGTVSQAALDTAIAAHAVADADVAAARSALHSAELNLSYTEIQAPIAGRIGRPLITRGNLVGPQSGTLARIVQTDPVRVVFSLSEGEVVAWRRARIAGTRGADASRYVYTLRLPDGSDFASPGALDFIESEVDPATGTIPVRAVFSNPEGLLVPGQNVTLRVAEDDPPTVPVVRQSAVQQDRQGRYVYVLEADDTVTRRPIVFGARVADGWVVQSGLQGGETVVVQGLQRLRPGLPVRPTTMPDPGR